MLVSCMRGWVWRPELEMHGWDLGGRLDLSQENEDVGQRNFGDAKKKANSSVIVWVQGAQMGEGRQGEIQKMHFF